MSRQATYDAAAALIPAGTSLTANQAPTWIDFFEAGSADIAVNVDVKSAAAGGTYVLEIQTADEAGANAVTHQIVTIPAGVSSESYQFVLDASTVRKFDDDARWIGINAQVTTGTLEVAAWVTLA